MNYYYPDYSSLQDASPFSGNDVKYKKFRVPPNTLL